MQDERWQQAIIGLVTLDLEGKIVAVNQTFTDLVGYTATELCGNHIEKVMNNGSRFFFPLIGRSQTENGAKSH